MYETYMCSTQILYVDVYIFFASGNKFVVYVPGWRRKGTACTSSREIIVIVYGLVYVYIQGVYRIRYRHKIIRTHINCWIVINYTLYINVRWYVVIVTCTIC